MESDAWLLLADARSDAISLQGDSKLQLKHR